MVIEKDPRMREALRLARFGEKERAYQLLLEILRQDRDNFDAWTVLAQVTDDRHEAISSMKQALQLRPDDERARRYHDYLLEDEQAEGTAMRMAKGSHGLLAAAGVAAIIILAVALLFFLSRLEPQAETGQPGATTGDQPAVARLVDCSALITKALEVSDQGCQAVGHNEVCYGHNTVQARLVAGSDARFEQPGNIVPVHLLESFAASPLDQQKGEWGVGVFKLEANLPGTLPGQLVTLLVLGNTMLQNVSGDMHAFYFTSGLGGLTCDAMPFDGILVRMAEGAGYTFEANGADITLQGTSILQAAANERLTVTALSGTGIVSALGQRQFLQSGQAVTVPLGGSSGLEAEGPPSSPQTADGRMLSADCALTGSGCPAVPAASSPATLEPTEDQLPPIDMPTPTREPKATLAPKPSAEPKPTRTPKPTAEPKPTDSPKPTGEPKLTVEPRPTKEPKPTDSPKPTGEPKPTDEPRPTKEPKPTDVIVPTPESNPANAPGSETDPGA